MATNRTFAELRTEARQTADMVGSDFVTDAELNRQLNIAIRRLHWKLVRARGEELYRFNDAAALSTVAGTAAYDIDDGVLTHDIMTLLGVDTTVNGDVQEILPLEDFSQRHQFQDINGWTQNGRIFYQLEGRTGNNMSIRFWPTPGAVHSIDFWYVPEATVYSSDGTEVTECKGFEKWVTLTVAIYCRQKEESDFADLMTEREMLQREIDAILTSAPNRVRPRNIRDVKGGHHTPLRRDQAWLGWDL